MAVETILSMEGKKIAYIFFFLFALCTLLSSCEDCYKCGIDQEEPYFNVKFLNARKLRSVNDSIQQIDKKNKENNTFLMESNKFLNSTLDSLDDEEDSIVIASLQLKVDSVESAIATLNKNINNLNTAKTKLNQVKKKIESGAVPLERIASPQGKEITFVSKDSLTTYKFPLPMNDTFATYFIEVNDSAYSLEVSYATEQTVEYGSVGIQANNLTVLSSTNLDSIVVLYRNDLRKTNETYLYLYF